jgi:hypothetical protein
MRRSYRVVVFAAVVLLVVGCARRPLWSCTQYARQVQLTQDAPRDRRLGVRLLRVEPDGTTVIHVAKSAETLSVKPAEFVLGEYRPPYNVRTFGERGLYLADSDPRAQSARLIHQWAVSRAN